VHRSPPADFASKAPAVDSKLCFSLFLDNPYVCLNSALARLAPGCEQRPDDAGPLRGLIAPVHVRGEAGAAAHKDLEYAIGAPCHAGLLQSMRQVKETAWITQETEEDGTQRQWTELDYVPSLKYEGKDFQPRRYIGIRLLKPQGVLFADGSDRQHHAVVTNRTEPGDRVLDWHREKAGTIEQVHDQVKNGLGGGRMPSGKFGANAAWFRIACIAFNVILALRAKWPDEELRTAHMKRLRFRIFHVTGRVVRDRRKYSLRVSASREWIPKLQALFDAFPLVTQATG